MASASSVCASWSVACSADVSEPCGPAAGAGPSLAGVLGRASGAVPGYDYSPAMKNAHLTWDEQTLDKFLQNPSGLVHGTKMFTSIPDAATRQRVG